MLNPATPHPPSPMSDRPEAAATAGSAIVTDRGAGISTRCATAWQQLRAALERSLPHDAIAALARFALAATFWRSGQTKVEGLSIDLVEGHFTLGWPHLSENAVALFRDEYQLPLLPPELAATLAATGEHLLPALLLLGLASRFAALGLLGMTAVIQLFVFPGAYPTHGIWAAALLLVIARGPGRWSVDHALGWEGKGR